MDEAKAADLHGFWASAVPEPLFKIGAPSVYLDMMTDGYPWFDVSPQVASVNMGSVVIARLAIR
jgi:hypothetical protein